MSEKCAVERIKQGDSAGLAWLVQRYQERAVRAAYVITQDQHLAEDVVQNAFLQLFSTIRTFDTRRPFAPWFFRSVVNAAVKAVKQTQRTLSIHAVIDAASEEAFEDLLPDIAALPSEQVEMEEMKQQIWEALNRLTPEQRAVVVMRYYLDLETSQIANDLDCPPATIRWRLHTALKRLRGMLLALNEE